MVSILSAVADGGVFSAVVFWDLILFFLFAFYLRVSAFIRGVFQGLFAVLCFEFW